MIDDWEIRAVPLDVKPAGDGNRLEGYAVVYDSLSNELPGGFREIIRPGALHDVLASTRDIPALYMHQPHMLLGRTSSGTLQLHEDQRGLAFSLALPDTQLGRDVREMVRRGDVGGASFSFKVASGGDRWLTEAGQKVRHVLRIGQFREVSITPVPAYSDTSVAVRSLEAWTRSQTSPFALLQARQKLSTW